MQNQTALTLKNKTFSGSRICCFSQVNIVYLLLFKVMICNLFLQHPFVTQLLTRNLVIELLDMANNPEIHNAHTHSMDDNELEVSTTRRQN